MGTTKETSSTISALYPYDLGMASSVKTQNDLGCRGVTGITAETGKTLQCQLIYGSNT